MGDRFTGLSVKTESQKLVLFRFPPKSQPQIIEVCRTNGHPRLKLDKAELDALFTSAIDGAVVLYLSEGKWRVSPLDPKQDAIVDCAWFGSIPAVSYPWAQCTLLQSLRDGTFFPKEAEMSRRVHSAVSLAEHLLYALNRLHKSKPKLIHADLRPANVLCTDEAAAVTDYFLADYGSLTGDGDSDAAPGGMGPVVTGERDSVFYSPVRRGSLEIEDLDGAVVRPIQTGGGLIILCPREDLAEASKVIASEALVPGDLKETQAEWTGARLRIRDLVFIVEGGVSGLPQCEERWRMFRFGRSYAVEYGKILRPTVFTKNLSLTFGRILVQKEWGEAVDHYALGVLLIYTLFSASALPLSLVDKYTEELVRFVENDKTAEKICSNIEKASLSGEREEWQECLKYMTQAIPRAYELAAAFKFDATGKYHGAFFLLALQFSLNCFRQSGRDGGRPDKRSELSAQVQHLRKSLEAATDPYVSGSDLEILEYDPRPAYELKALLEESSAEISELKNRNAKIAELARGIGGRAGVIRHPLLAGQLFDLILEPNQ